jgi:membrane protease YdiL (CAAX protease family)
MSLTGPPESAAAPALLQRHPLACFFILTYGAAWLLWAPLIIFRGSIGPVVGLLLTLLGSLVPSAVAVVFKGLMDGKPGVREFLGRLVRWRVSLRWYLVVLLLPTLAPLGLAISVLLGGRVPTVDTSILMVLVLFLFSIFPGSALGEELGWRGFALPHLQKARSALAAALIVGSLWGPWHLPLFLAGNDGRPLALFPLFVLSTVAFSVLLSWVYNGTGGSVLLVVLLHATVNLPISLLITPLGSAMIQPFAIFTALMIGTAAVVVWLTGPANLSRTKPRQVA